MEAQQQSHKAQELPNNLHTVVDSGTVNATVSQATGSNLHAVIDSEVLMLQ